MFRWLIRKIAFCLVVLAAFHYLNQTNPQWLQTVGRWIGGEVGNKVSIAVSGIVEGVEESGALSEVIEVFREGT